MNGEHMRLVDQLIDDTLISSIELLEQHRPPLVSDLVADARHALASAGGVRP